MKVFVGLGFKGRVWGCGDLTVSAYGFGFVSDAAPLVFLKPKHALPEDPDPKPLTQTINLPRTLNAKNLTQQPKTLHPKPKTLNPTNTA